MSHKKKQERLRAGSRRKRGLQLEGLERRALMTATPITEYSPTPVANSNPSAITSAYGNSLAYTLPGSNQVGLIVANFANTGGSSNVDLPSGANAAGITFGNGYLWVTEPGTNQVAKISIVGGVGSIVQQLTVPNSGTPQGITADAAGDIFFTDSTNNAVYQIPATGSNAGTIQPFTSTTGVPSAISDFVSNGHEYVIFVEGGGNKVGTYRLDTNATATISLPSGTTATSITGDSVNNIFVTDNGNNSLVKISAPFSNSSTVAAFTIPTSSSNPQGITADNQGNVIFTENSGNSIGSFQDALSTFSTPTNIFGATTTVPTSSSGPKGITRGPDGNLWFTETTANKIGKYTPYPVASNVTYGVAPTGVTNISSANGVLNSVTDPLGNGLTVTGGTGTFSIANGSVTFNSDGSFSFTPNTGASGSSNFVYAASDGIFRSNSGFVYVAIDTPPTAVNDTYTTPVSTTLTVNTGSGVLANDTDPNTEHTITASVVSGPIHGEVTLNADGSFTYFPSGPYHGTDSFTYQDTDSDGITLSNVATVNLIVDNAPVAGNDGYTTDAGTTLTVSSPASGVLANDTAYNGDALTVASADVGTFATGHGSITMAANGTFSYTPANGFTGYDSIFYFAYDGYQNSANPGVITFTVNALPTGTTHSYEGLKGNTLNVNAASGVLHSATGTGSLTAVLVSGPSDATSGGFTLNPNGSFVYTPTASFSGTDSFTYKVYDGIAYSSPKTVSLYVDAPPVGVPPTYVVAEGADNYIDGAHGLLLGATSTFDDELSVNGLTQTSHGSVGLNSDGSFDYYSAPNYHGIDSFTYTITDGYATSSVYTATFYDDTPAVALDKSFTDVQNTSLNMLASQGLLVGATDADTNPVDTLTAVDLTQPSHGSVTISPNGSFSYIPTSGYYGYDSFTYAVYDGYGNSAPATVSVYVDQPPVGVNDHYNVVENTSLNKNAAQGVLANDTNSNAFSDPAALTAGLVQTTAHGTLNLFQDGSFTYTPNTGYYGDDTFTYQANDGITDSPITTVTIHVDAPPVGVNDSYGVVENQTTSVNAADGVLANDTQAQNESLTSSLISNVTHGSLTLYQDGSFNYTPADNYYGPDSFTYKPYDGIANGNITTVSIFVDSPPVANNDDYETALENTPFVVNAASGVLANDSQAQSESLTAVNVIQPEFGSVTLNADGSFTYTPNTDFYGTDSFTYYAYDGHTDSLNPATVTIRVDATPVGVADNYEVLQDGSLDEISDFGLLSNDSQAQDDNLTAVNFTNPSHGTLTPDSGDNTGDGGFTYVPDAGFYGTDTFTYVVNDGFQNGNTVTVTILVDQPPVGHDDYYSVPENTSLLYENAQNGELANDTSFMNQPLTATNFTNPAVGTIDTNSNGSFNYHTVPNYYGDVTFTYQPYDGFAYGNTATVHVHVDATVNAVNDSYNAKEGLPLAVNAANGILANDSQAQSETLTPHIDTNPTHGTLSLNADGSFTYTPNAQYFGTDTFTYHDNDGYQNSSTTTVTLNVAQDFAPTANNVSQVVGEGGISVNAPGILTGDTDSNGEPLSAVLVSGPAHGTLTFNADGSYVYIPNSSFGSAGTDSFTFRTFDNVLTSSLATATLTFDGNYYAPVAQPQTYGVLEGSTLTKTAPGLLTGASDYWNLPLNAVITTGPVHGTLTPDQNGDGGFTYTPTAGYFGSDSFTYEASNGHTDSSAQTVNINVSQTYGAPTAANDSYTLNENATLTENAVNGVLANDTDPNSLPLSAILVTNPSHGTIQLNGNGSFVYTPTAGYYGSDTFTYKDTDGQSIGNTATVTLTITQVYYPPTAINQTYTIPNGETLNISSPGVLLGDTDPNGLSLNSQLFDSPTHDSSFTLNPDGSFTYIPTPGYVGTDTFTYKAADSQAISSLATVTITITNPIVVTGTTASATAGTSFSGNVGSFTDANPTAAIGNFTATIYWGDSSTSAGTITQPGGVGTVFQVIGSHNYSTTGNLTATIVITDNNENSGSASTTVNVATGAPVAVNDPYYGLNENGYLNADSSFGVLANDTDPQGDPLTAILVTSPAHGSLSFNGDGSFLYTPAAGYYGTDSFTYKDNNGVLSGNTATVTFTVNQVFYPPVAVNDSYSATGGTLLSRNAASGLLANDTDPQSLSLTAASVTNPSHGSLVLNADGSFTYTPAAGFIGTDTFTYDDTDGHNTSNTATVTITVTNPITVTGTSLSATQASSFSGNVASFTDTDPTASIENFTALIQWGDSNSSPGTITQPGGEGTAFLVSGTHTYATSGSFTATVTIIDNLNNTASANTAVNVAAQGDIAPVAVNDSQTVGETGFTATTAIGGGDVLANDADFSETPLTALFVSGPSHGNLVFNANGTYTYTPNSSFGTAGSDSFTYRAFDGTLASNIATVTLTFNGTYLPPTAQARSYSTTENSTLAPNLSAGLLAGATDYWGLNLTAIDVTQPAHGSVTVNTDGSFTYTPTSGYFGPDSFSYKANNGHTDSTPQTVSLTVTQTFGAPVATNDSYTTAEATPLAKTAINGVLANDTDPNSLPLTAILVTNPSHGAVAFNADGSFTYTPVAGFYGTDSFTYKDTDGQAIGNTATVTLTVTQVFYPPTAVNDNYTVIENTTFGPSGANVLTNDTDPQSLSLTVADPYESNPTDHGFLMLGVDGSFTYTPNAGFTGTDTFTYYNTDGHNISNTATVTITVISPLTVTGTTTSATAGTSFSGNVGSFTDVDPTASLNNFTATIHWGDSSTSAGTITQPGGVGTAFLVSGTHTYGTTGNLTASVVITDNNENSASANTTVNIGAGAPVANNDGNAISENTTLSVNAQSGVLANDTDPQMHPLTALLVTNPAHGTLVLNGDGSYTYTPNSYYYGTDIFTYKDSDGLGTSNTATVYLTINQVQYAPVAVADSYNATENTNLSVPAQTSPLVNDSQPQGDPFTFSPINIHTSQGGLILQDTPGTGAFIYQPPIGFTGTDTFQYKAIDSNNDLSSNIVTVTITVNAPSPVAPVAANDSQTVGETGITTTTSNGGGDVLANDTDNSQTPLSALLVSQPAHGALTFNSNGTYVYTPNSSFGTAGSDSFTYRAFDGTLLSNVATVTLTFDGTYLPPTAVAQSYSVPQGGTLTETAQSGLLNGASDYWTLPLTAVITSQPAHGNLTSSNDGSFTYVPTSGYSGPDSFTYEANNGQTSSTAQTVALTIGSVENAPVAVNDFYTVAEGATLTIGNMGGVLADDTSPNPLSAILLTQPAEGTLTFNPNGSFTYVPNNLFYGADTFTYKAFDGTQYSQPATVTLTVLHVNHPPVAVNSSYSITEGTPLSVSAPGVLSGATDLDHDSLTAIDVTEPAHGSLVLHADGSFTYTPQTGYSGTDSFTFEANDGLSNSNVATVNLTIAPVAQAPVAVADFYAQAEGTTLTIGNMGGILADDIDNGPNPLTAVLVAGPTQGTLSLNPNGSFTYTPNAGFSGVDRFTYKANDGVLDSNTTTVTLTVSPTQPAPKPETVVNDYFGTGESDVAVYLVNQAAFAIRPSTGGSDVIVPFGIAGAGQTIPAPGDYFGTGVTDIAAYIASTGSFAIRNPAGGPDEVVPFGLSGVGQTIPAPGDYFGTGQTDIAAYLPSLGAFAIRNPAGGPDQIIPFGMAGSGKSIPAPGDYDGSGKTEIAVYLPSLGEFAYRPANGGPDVIVPFGLSGTGQSIPMPGDYDGSGKTEFAVYMPSLGEFAYRPANGGPDVIESFGIAGAGQTLPAPGDYTGVGHDQLAAYLPASGTFAIQPGGSSPDTLQPFGISGLGQTIPLTVVDQALAETSVSTVTAQSIPEPSEITDNVIFPTTTAKKKKHRSE